MSTKAPQSAPSGPKPPASPAPPPTRTCRICGGPVDTSKPLVQRVRELARRMMVEVPR